MLKTFAVLVRIMFSLSLDIYASMLYAAFLAEIFHVSEREGKEVR